MYTVGCSEWGPREGTRLGSLGAWGGLLHSLRLSSVFSFALFISAEVPAFANCLCMASPKVHVPLHGPAGGNAARSPSPVWVRVSDPLPHQLAEKGDL